MRHAIFLFSVFCFLFSVLTGCDKLDFLNPKQVAPKKPLPAMVVQGTIIAQVDNLPITLEDLNEEIESYNAMVPADQPQLKITTREQKITYLNEELIRRYLFYIEAKARGLDKEAKTQELLRKLEINLLANQFAQDQINNAMVTSSEIEDFYSLYKEQYLVQEERKIREIVVSTEAEARDALIELLKGADFATLAQQRSRAESASQGGDLGFIKRGQRGADFVRFDDVAFSPSLEVGQISNIFKEKQGYYILKLEQRKGGQARPLSEVWDEIKRGVTFLKQQQRLKELSDKLLKDTKVVIYEDKIK